MRQTWHNLLFAHWPVPLEALRPLVHPDLQIDTFNGTAWLCILPFALSGIRLRGLPPLPFAERFTEINVRTYVTDGTKPGIYFLSLDTGNPLVTAFARPWFHMPYCNARIQFHRLPDGVVFCSGRATGSGQHARFCASYAPTSEPYFARRGTLEHWLTERYCFYCASSHGRLYRCEAHHPQWSLQDARADILENTLARIHGIELPDTAPLLHYARHMQALIWPVVRVGGRNWFDIIRDVENFPKIGRAHAQNRVPFAPAEWNNR